jgi:hypothetical protein
LLHELQALLQGRDVEREFKFQSQALTQIVGAKPAITGDLDGSQFSLNDLHGYHTVTYRLVRNHRPRVNASGVDVQTRQSQPQCLEIFRRQLPVHIRGGNLGRGLH